MANEGQLPWTGGGGLIASNIVTLDRMVFSGNNTLWRGGAIAIEGTGFLTLRNCTITGNSSVAPGSGVWMQNGGLLVENSTIAGNIAYPGFGGGVYFTGTVSTSPPRLHPRHPRDPEQHDLR